MIREFSDAQRAWDATHEEGYWWYFSDQDGPSLNSYVQMEAIRPRLLFWLVSCTSITAIFPTDQPCLCVQGAAHDVSGWLYWCLDCWEKYGVPGQPPSVQELRRVNGTMLVEAGDDVSGFGDGSQIYPSLAGPVSSIRFENLADGAEDRELLHRLPLAERRALVSEMWFDTPTPDTWRNDPAKLEQLRREAARRVLLRERKRAKPSKSDDVAFALRHLFVVLLLAPAAAPPVASGMGLDAKDFGAPLTCPHPSGVQVPDQAAGCRRRG